MILFLFQDGLETASEKTRACKKETEEETSECLNKLTGYSECLANPSFEHHRPSKIFGIKFLLRTRLKNAFTV